MKFQRVALSAQCMPYEMEKFDECLEELIKNKHILPYESDGKKYLFVPKFTEHQKPHHSEKPKGYPDYTPLKHGADTVKQPRKDAREGEKEGEGDIETRDQRPDACAREDDLPAWLNKKAWSEWISYRKESKKKMTKATIKKQLSLLEQHQRDHVSIINQSIQNGWTGLFPLKNRGSPGYGANFEENSAVGAAWVEEKKRQDAQSKTIDTEVIDA